MKARSPRIFRLKHALLCNPAVGPSLIQHWAKEGYLLHGKERQGSVERLTFSFSELVWLSLLVRLSWFGAIKKDTLVEHARSEAHDEDNRFFTGQQKLTRPWSIFKALETRNWNMLVTITAFPVKVASPTSRSKQVGIWFGIRLHDMPAEEPSFHVRRNHDFSDAITFIDVRRIHDDVQEALGMS